MRHVEAVLGTFAALLWVVTALAQTQNFSGKWTPDASKNMGPGINVRGASMGGMTVIQDTKTLTITASAGQNIVTTKYNLDGSDSINTPPGYHGTAGKAEVSNASWDGAKLVIRTHLDTGDMVDTWSMDELDLVIVRNFANAPQHRATKTYYRKGS
jgi:hypothetical protein